MFGLHLAVDGVAVFFACLHVRGDALTIHGGGDGVANFLHELFAVAAGGNNRLLN